MKRTENALCGTMGNSTFKNSKSVCGQPHGGSNPSRCAHQKMQVRQRFSLLHLHFSFLKNQLKLPEFLREVLAFLQIKCHFCKKSALFDFRAFCAFFRSVLVRTFEKTAISLLDWYEKVSVHTASNLAAKQTTGPPIRYRLFSAR